MQSQIMNETFGSCKPWAYDNLKDNLNILNNFKQNLCSYEKVYKKYSVKTRAQLPQIRLPSMIKRKKIGLSSKINLVKIINQTFQSNSKQSKEGQSNKSIKIQPCISYSKITKIVDDSKRGQTSLQMINKQNQIKEEKQIVTQRGHCNQDTSSKSDIKNKIRLINFEQQFKYRRLRKREMHQIIFGQRQKLKKPQLAVLR